MGHFCGRSYCGRPRSLHAAAEPAVVAADRGQPTHEEIARLARSYWEARGCQGGNPTEDWLRAEQELKRGRE